MNPKSLQPSLALDTVYGENLVLVPHPSPSYGRWLPQNPLALEMLTGGMLTIVGSLPLLCAASVSTPDGLTLLEDAGFSIPTRLHRFLGMDDHRRQMEERIGAGQKLALQHVYPEWELSSDHCWVSPKVLSFLNNKAHLADLVPGRQVPMRRLHLACDLAQGLTQQSLPLVIKAVTAESTGGGCDVQICHTITQVKQAEEIFRFCDQVVVEDYLDIRRNLCLNFAIGPVGTVHYLGSSEQMTDSSGTYHGNWLDEHCQAPPSAVAAGHAIARKGFEHGYWGCLGIDIAILENGGIKIFDLNFRLNGSTPLLLLAKQIKQVHNKSVLNFRVFRSRQGYRKMLDSVYRFMAKGSFLPLNSCDPGCSTCPAEPPRVAGILLGDTRLEILELLEMYQESDLEVL